MRNGKFQFLPNSARTWLFSCQPPVALLAALHLQEGRQGSREGQVEGVWLLWFVPRRCWQCLCVSRGAGMSPSLAGGSGGWEGGWQCLGWVEMSCFSHPNPFQAQSRGQSSPVLHSPQCWLEPDTSSRVSTFCGVGRARCEAFQLPQLGTGPLAKAKPSLAICLPSRDGTGALFPRRATRDVACPAHHCCSVPGLRLPNACARAGRRAQRWECPVQGSGRCVLCRSSEYCCSQ